MIWYKEKIDSDIIVSTRVRLARNLEKYPFPHTLNDEGKKSSLKQILKDKGMNVRDYAEQLLNKRKQQTIAEKATKITS